MSFTGETVEGRDLVREVSRATGADGNPVRTVRRLRRVWGGGQYWTCRVDEQWSPPPPRKLWHGTPAPAIEHCAADGTCRGLLLVRQPPPSLLRRLWGMIKK